MKPDSDAPRARPVGVSLIAALFLITSAYLIVVGAVMLLSSGAISMSSGADLLGGLEVAGPFMFLLIALVATAIGVGLLQLHNWARRLAILTTLLGMVLLLPSVSSAVLDYRISKLVWGGLGVMVRAMIVWYLYQQPVKEVFIH
jgi:multidrug transporter EmrE-like cation transporter